MNRARRRPSITTWLAIASIVTLVGGLAWLGWLARSDARRASMRVDRGETVTIEYELDDPHEFSTEERAAIAEVARQALPDIRRVLPQAPASIALRVSSAPKDKVAPETGDAADIAQPNIVRYRIDPTRKEGIVAIVRSLLRQTLFHEVHHLVRSAEIIEFTLHDELVLEGLATVFERDYGSVTPPPWGQYAPEVEDWAREILAQPKDASRAMWITRHPDGRRWLGYRAGTFIVDCASRASGKTSLELIYVPAATLVAMCPNLGTPREGDASAPR